MEKIGHFTLSPVPTKILKTVLLGATLTSLASAFEPVIWAGDQVGTLTQSEGNVRLFHHPSKTLQKEQGAPHALFEGEYYLVTNAKPGDKVEKGNIVVTAPEAKARVVFDNGDQYNVGPATAYRVKWNQDTAKATSEIDLKYGKLRGIIEKGGPRSHLQIKTRTAVMGVRGTDFFIASGGKQESTEVSIMRGKVEVTPRGDKEAKPIEINPGFSANIAKSPASEDKTHPLPVSPSVELRKTTQEELVGIQKTSTFTPPTTPPPPQIAVLEKKATVTTLKDIQAANPAMVASLGKRPLESLSADELNRACIQALIKDAPKAPKNRKPYQSEIEDIGDKPYDKYFKELNE